MKTYEALAGSNISDAAIEMVNLANQSGESVQCEFNDITIVAHPKDDPATITKHYSEESNRRYEAYKNSPAGIEAERRSQEFQKQAAQAESEGILNFEVSDATFWQKQVEANKDGYGSGVIRYAARWANYMERELAAGKSLKDIADATSQEADKEGITGFMYGAAVSILSKVWKQGEELRRWHNLNTQLGSEGEKANESGGTLNPALLSIG